MLVPDARPVPLRWVSRLLDVRGCGLLVGALVFAVGVLMRETSIPPGEQLPLMATAAGGAMVWYAMTPLTGPGRAPTPLLIFAIILGLSTVVDVLVGRGAGHGLMLGLSVNATGAVGAFVWRRRVRRRDLASIADLTSLLLAGIGGGIAGLFFLPLHMVLAGEIAVGGVLDWVLLNAGSILVTGAVWFRLVGERHRDGLRPRWSAVGWALAVNTATCGLLWAAPDGSLPYLFVLIPVGIGVAITRPATETVVHVATTSTIIAVLASYEVGPFVHGTADSTGIGGSESTLARSFILVFAFVVTALALDREARMLLLRQVSTARVNAESQAALYDTTIGALREGVVVVPEWGDPAFANEAAHALLGAGAVSPHSSQAVDQVARRLRHDTRFWEVVRQAQSGRVEARGDLIIDDQSRPVRILELRAYPLVYRGPRSAVVVIQDVTSAREYAEELVRFAGRVAHELRSPLADVARCSTELERALSDAGSDAGAEPLTHIRAATLRMTGLIDDLFAHAVAEEGLRPREIDLAPLFDDVARSWARPSGERTPQIIAWARGSAYADPLLLRQVLDNLVENAVKYTPAARDARVHLSAVRQPPGWVTIRVDDEGIGVPADATERIFEEFARESSASHGRPGLGLGLAICRSIVHQHGGTIHALRRTVGTRVEFRIPAGEAEWRRSVPGRPGR